MYKKILVPVVLGIIVTISSSQVPQKISYQAVVRNPDGTVIPSTQVRLRVSFLDGTSSIPYYSEEHTAITSNQGLVFLTLGEGTQQLGSFAAINWTSGNILLKIELYKSDSWVTLGTSALNSVPFALYSGSGGALSGSGEAGSIALWSGSSSLTKLPNLTYTSSLVVTGNATQNPDDPIFEVKNSLGEVLFGVYQEGVRINIKDDMTKGTKGGFAVGGLSGTKLNKEYFRITSDSARIYVNENSQVKGGFAVGGLSGSKIITKQDLLFVAPDSSRIYVRESAGKGAKGGFAVGGLSGTKTSPDNFLQLTPANYFIGHQSGSLISSGQYNSVMGYMAGAAISSGSYNSFIGYNAGLSNSSGSSNVFIGYECGKANTTGYSNVVIGKSSAISSNGNNNIVIGENAGYSLTSGIHNTLIGTNAAHSLTNQDYNVMIGTSAGYHISSLGWSGSFNTFMGINAGYKIATSRDNTFIGTNSGMWLENGERNTIVGIDAGRSGNEHNNGYTANDNTIFGCKAGYNILNGSTNLFLGTEAGFSNQSGTGNVFIGYRAGFSELGSNKLYISNSSVGSPLVYGDFSSKKVGINTTTLTSTLNVGGDLAVTGTITASSLNSNISGNVNNLQMMPFNYNVSSTIVELANTLFRIDYKSNDMSLWLFNGNGTLSCGYRIVKQISPNIIESFVGSVSPENKQEVMVFHSNGEGCELHFFDYNGTAYAKVSLTYANGKVFGHYVKY